MTVVLSSGAKLGELRAQLGDLVNDQLVFHRLETIRHLRRSGKHGAQERGRRRLRPILMTTATKALAVLPMALAIGEGAEVQAPLARIVLGGLVVSAMITRPNQCVRGTRGTRYTRGMDSTAIEEKLREFFAADARKAVAVYLFGSVARGTAGSTSDVDVALLMADPPPRTLSAQPFALADELSGVLGRRTDVVVLNTAAPDLIHRVLRDSILVMDAAPGVRAEFEVRARNAYFDLKPFLDRYRAAAGTSA